MIHGTPGTPAFAERYNELLALSAPAKPAKRGKAEKGTVAWVIEQYRATSKAWAKAKPATREKDERRFSYLNEHFGTAEFASFTEKNVRAIRNSLRDRTSVADAVVRMIGRLWRFTKEHIDGMDTLGPNPTREVAAIHTAHEPHKAWSDELCAAIEKHPNPRVPRAYYLLRYTGQRISDVAVMKSKQFDGTARSSCSS